MVADPDYPDFNCLRNPKLKLIQIRIINHILNYLLEIIYHNQA
jgi:hypothetical protein